MKKTTLAILPALYAFSCNPTACSHIPFPYPKTQSEVIADLKSEIIRYYGPRIVYSGKGFTISANNIMSKFLCPHSGIKIGQIDKVTNKTSTNPDKYFFFITLNDREGTEVAHLALYESGRFAAGNTISNSQKRFDNPSKTKKEALIEVEAFIDSSSVIKTERIYMGNVPAPSPSAPTWEITTLDSKYYLDWGNYRPCQLMFAKWGHHNSLQLAV